MVPALEAFVGRWLRAAAAAAAAPSANAKASIAPVTRAAAALAAMHEVWGVLRAKLDAGGPPGAFESSLLAAATLCSLAPTAASVEVRKKKGADEISWWNVPVATSRAGGVHPRSSTTIPRREVRILGWCSHFLSSIAICRLPLHQVRLLVAQVLQHITAALAAAQTDSAVRACAVAVGVAGASSPAAAALALRLLTSRVHECTASAAAAGTGTGTGGGASMPSSARGLGRAGVAEALGMLAAATAEGDAATTAALLHTLLCVAGGSCASLRLPLEALAAAASPRLALPPLRWCYPAVAASGATGEILPLPFLPYRRVKIQGRGRVRIQVHV